MNATYDDDDDDDLRCTFVVLFTWHIRTINSIHTISHGFSACLTNLLFWSTFGWARSFEKNLLAYLERIFYRSCEGNAKHWHWLEKMIHSPPFLICQLTPQGCYSFLPKSIVGLRDVCIVYLVCLVCAWCVILCLLPYEANKVIYNSISKFKLSQKVTNCTQRFTMNFFSS